MSSGRLRIGTRGSALALWQARHVAALIDALPEGPKTEIIVIETAGDQNTDQPLWAAGDRSYFTKAIDERLLDFSIDIAVHSLKDLETSLEPGLTLGAILTREDPRDVLVSQAGWTLETLPEAAQVGTSSLRRRGFLLHSRPDVQIGNLRGNVPTRMDQVESGAFDAVVLAAAGLKRLGLYSERCIPLPTDVFPPAIGQGAIAVACRGDDKLANNSLSDIDHRPTRMTVTAERRLLRRLQGGCHAPIGALAKIEGDQLCLQAQVCSPDGRAHIEAHATLPLRTSEALSKMVADDLKAKGAAEIIENSRTQMEQAS